VTIQRSLDASSDAPRRGASRPTIILGFASIGGLLGMVAGAYVGATAFGMAIPDDAEYLPFSMMLGAGAGWLGGAGIGSMVGEGARAPGTIGRKLVLLGAVAVVIGAVIAIWPVSSAWPDGGVTFFWSWRAGRGGLAFETVILVDATLAVMTFLAVSRHHVGEDSGRPGRVAGATGIAGLLLGGSVFALGLGLVALCWSETVAHQQYRAVYRTTTSLASAAAEHEARTGSFPTNLEEVLVAGGKVRPGAQVEFAGVVNGSFCVRVGVDVGDVEERAGDPHYSALVHRRPAGSKAWTSGETWEGNSCTSS
jgi:hypothetical protein